MQVMGIENRVIIENFKRSSEQSVFLESDVSDVSNTSNQINYHKFIITNISINCDSS